MDPRGHYPSDPSGPRGAFPPPQNINQDFQRLSIDPSQFTPGSEGGPSGSGLSSSYQDVYVPEPGARPLGAAGIPPTQPVLPVELPPQAFLTSAMTIDFIDKKVVVCLRDGKGFIGVLRLYDQFANLTLCDAIERVFVPDPEAPKTHWLYCDTPAGMITFRGENVSVVAEVDLDREDDPIPNSTKAPPSEVLPLLKAERTKKKAHASKKESVLKELGFEPENPEA